jgi:hypothetical protein
VSADASAPRRVEKRKLEEGGESAGSLPPIKLKLSLKPAADTSADSEYKVKQPVITRYRYAPDIRPDNPVFFLNQCSSGKKVPPV